MSNPRTLNFSEYLKQLPSEFIINTFLAESRGNRRVVSSHMIEEIANRLSTEQEIQKRFFRLNLEQQLRCSWMYLMGRNGIDTKNPKAVFNDPLVSSFLGYAAKREREVRIFGFTSFEKHLKSEISLALAENSSEKVSISLVPRYEFSYVNDVAVVLSFASKNLLIKKKSGKIATNVLQQLKKLLHIHHFYENSDLEIVVSSIIEYCKLIELIEELDDRYIISHNAISSWLKRTNEENAEEIKKIFIKKAGEWNIEILLKACEYCGDRWLKVPSFLIDDEKNVRSALLLLDFVNIIEIKKHKQGLFFQKSLVRLSPKQQDSNSKTTVIMPDFSLLISEENFIPDLYAFSCFSKLNTLDHIYHGKIDKESITTAVANCCETEAVLLLLEKNNAPANVILSVKEWIREFLRISLCKNQTLIICDKKTSEQLIACKELNSFIKEIPVSTIFVIKNGAEIKAERVLKDMGFDIRMPLINYMESDTSLPSVNDIFLSRDESNWFIVVENEEIRVDSKLVIKGSKYSSELKKLDLAETIQVIDYAILTSQKLIFSYCGSNYIKKGIYTVVPLRCSKGAEPMLDGEVENTASRKQFYVKKIDSIGVI